MGRPVRKRARARVFFGGAGRGGKAVGRSVLGALAAGIGCDEQLFLHALDAPSAAADSTSDSALSSAVLRMCSYHSERCKEDVWSLNVVAMAKDWHVVFV